MARGKNPDDNRGARALRKSGLSQADIVRLLQEQGLDVDSSLVNRWWHGSRRPMTPVRVVFGDELGIDLLAWDQPIGRRAA